MSAVIAFPPEHAEASFQTAQAPDPSLDWARSHPEALLRFLFVSPRPCEALDDLLGLQQPS